MTRLLRKVQYKRCLLVSYGHHIGWGKLKVFIDCTLLSFKIQIIFPGLEYIDILSIYLPFNQMPATSSHCLTLPKQSIQELSNNYVNREGYNVPFGIHIKLLNFCFCFVKICNIYSKLYKTWLFKSIFFALERRHEW